uniref:hypothetical protein n=1 Tax=Neisseria sicca TaxID=490 RepID=UPI001C99D36B
EDGGVFDLVVRDKGGGIEGSDGENMEGREMVWGEEKSVEIMSRGDGDLELDMEGLEGGFG